MFDEQKRDFYDAMDKYSDAVPKKYASALKLCLSKPVLREEIFNLANELAIFMANAIVMSDSEDNLATFEKSKNTFLESLNQSNLYYIVFVYAVFRKHYKFSIPFFSVPKKLFSQRARSVDIHFKKLIKEKQ